MVCPQVTVAGLVLGHRGVHTQRPPVQSAPSGHAVPVPQDGPPEHTLGMLWPQATEAGLVLGHRGLHTHCPEVHTEPLGHWVPAPQAGSPEQTLAMG